MLRKIVFGALTVLLILLSQKCKTVEEEPDYTYSIDSVWWADSIDANGDGYTSYRKLYFDVRLKENVSRDIIARVFYKLKEASDFSFYAYSEKSVAQGNNIPNILSVSIGKPHKELPRGLYEFKIEIVEAGKSRLEAATGKQDSIVLCNNAFEPSESDNNYSMKIYWQKQCDYDQDGYWKNAFLVIDANNDADITSSMRAKVYMKPSDSLNYPLQNPLADLAFSITNSSANDTVSVPVGFSPNDLEHGEYDFRIELYKVASLDRTTLVGIADNNNTPELNRVKFETEEEDTYHFSIDSVWWSDYIDVDKDGFTSSRHLHFDVNVDRQNTFSIFAKVFVLPPDSEDYQMIDSTDMFDVSSNTLNDAYAVTIPPADTVLDSAKYNFMISVYRFENDTLTKILFTVSARSREILKEQSFESVHQDSTGIKP